MSDRDRCESVRVIVGTDSHPAGTIVRFVLTLDALPIPAFAVLTPQGWRAFVDRCRHLPLTLDPGRGSLSGDGGRTLTCERHFATYEAASGACLGGACEGRALLALALEQRADGWWCVGRART